MATKTGIIRILHAKTGGTFEPERVKVIKSSGNWIEVREPGRYGFSWFYEVGNTHVDGWVPLLNGHGTHVADIALKDCIRLGL